MKKYMFSLLLAFAATGAVAQTIGNTLHIFRNDGQLNSFLRQDVDSITYSCYDADGKLFPDVITQVIHTQDTILYIMLSVIDSVSFIKTDAICPDSKHPHMIDLGLPSGTLWSCCNVGANYPEETGEYFAWGETEPKTIYNSSTYKWFDSDNKILKKYNTYSGIDTYDNKMQLELSDDVAYMNWDENWSMPTYVQLKELIDNYTPQSTKLNGTNGNKIYSKNGACIFLPATGRYWDTELKEYGFAGYYWSSTLSGSYPFVAYGIGFYCDGTYWDNYLGSRYGGLPVRPVRRK